MNNHYLYLVINIATVIFPLLFSFEKRVAYYRSWRSLLPSLLMTAALFIFWDRFFTLEGIWGFNPAYITGYTVFGLPVEEVMFFFTIPYASIFIYSFLNTFYPQATFFDRYAGKIILGILAVSVLGLVFYYDHTYTALNCAYAIILLALQQFLVKGAYMGRFYRFYCWHLIPFFIVNGILTGSGIAGEVVWYQPDSITGLRLVTIPVEDTLYSMSLMLMNIMLFEYLQSRVKHRSLSVTLSK